MSYNIYNIGEIPVDEYPLYFCDANVWIVALKTYGSGSVASYEAPYETFIEAIVNLNEQNDPKLVKKIKNKPKIVLTSLVLSEIINAFMRNVAMKTYFGGGNEYKGYDFKKDYRDKPGTDYKSQLRDLCSDLKAFYDYTVLVNDDFKTIEPFSFLPSLSSIDADFNDLYYYHFLKDKNIPFVTHDKDCKFEDIVLISARRELLNISDIT